MFPRINYCPSVAGNILRHVDFVTDFVGIAPPLEQDRSKKKRYYIGALKDFRFYGALYFCKVFASENGQRLFFLSARF